jgi:hypothetical protein
MKAAFERVGNGEEAMVMKLKGKIAYPFAHSLEDKIRRYLRQHTTTKVITDVPKQRSSLRRGNLLLTTRKVYQK